MQGICELRWPVASTAFRLTRGSPHLLLNSSSGFPTRFGGWRVDAKESPSRTTHRSVADAAGIPYTSHPRR